MSLIHLDFPSGSPGMYGTSAALMLNGVYAEVDLSWMALVEDPDPNVTGNVLLITRGSPAPTLRKVLPTSATKVGIARRVWLPELPDVAGNFISLMDWRDASNNILGSVYVNTTGRLVIVAGGVTVTSTSPIIIANAWQHIEAVMDTVAGSVSVRVEGIAIVSSTGLTLTGPIEQIGVLVNFEVTFNGIQYMKDFVIWDGAGGQNNNWMGPIQVFDLTPNGDISSGWASTGPNDWSVLDETPPNDADYIEADDTLPAASIVAMSEMPPDIIAVRGLVTFTRAWKTDGGDATLVTGLSPDGTNWDNGSDIPVSTAATYWTRVSELSPATAAAWTPLEVSTLRFRFNRTV